MIGHERHENVFTVPERSFATEQDDIIPNEVRIGKEGGANVALCYHELCEDNFCALVGVGGRIAVEAVVRYQVTSEASNDTLRVPAKLNEHIVESRGWEFHIVVDVDDPVVLGQLAKVEPQRQSHLVVVLSRIDVDDLGMDILKGCLGVGMEQQNFIDVWVSQEGPHETRLADHPWPTVIHEHHRHLLLRKRQRDIGGHVSRPEATRRQGRVTAADFQRQLARHVLD